MMLNPSMKELLSHINNRYLLVNITAKRARDISEAAKENKMMLTEKPVKMALDDIMNDRITVSEDN